LGVEQRLLRADSDADSMPVQFAGFRFRKTDSGTYLVLPLWSPVVVLAIMPSVWLWRSKRRLKSG